MIGDNIKKFRELNQLSLSSLAKKCNMSVGYLSDIEKNKKDNPSYDILNKIADALNIYVSDLYKEDSEPMTEEIVKEYNKSEQERYLNSSLSDEIQFKTPEAAMKFILKQPAIAAYGGFDVNKMSDEEIMEFANELLHQLHILGFKYKK
ncbi:helix-turn-helix domain-containing protein [Clostridium guangxiense]|uniref:helix-turn-helix domain-containing protein n=1 Tax=Clostridium guangxiense TaxID=1662055 RepID=UPI001E5A2850|nr:helix-turn-helix transcriptional regulator [Clostridium guangxiense]MCD2345767.1 helix-turn-helix domain-containing protein [Clostridium guangxiense]